MRLKEVMNAPRVMLVIGNMVLCNELQPILTPLFRLGLFVPRHDSLPQSNIVQTILIILHQPKAGPHLVTPLISYLSEFVGNLGSDMLEEFAKLDLFDAIAAFPAKAPMKSSLVATIGLFRAQFLSLFNSPQSSVIRELNRALSCNQVDSEILDMLMLFAVTQSKVTGTSTFGNRAGLKSVWKFMKDSDDEGQLLKVLLELTGDSVINTYQCFSCDVMERICHDKFIKQCFVVFQRILSKLFSPLAQGAKHN
jgi:hypothetical protein